MYCTIDDIKLKLPESDIIDLTDDANTGAINTSIVNSAIADAESLINMYIRSHATLPLTVVPTMIKKIAVELSKFYLYERRGDVPENVKESYDEQKSLLKDIQKGVASLGVETETEDTKVTDSGRFVTNKTSDSKVFSEELLNNY